MTVEDLKNYKAEARKPAMGTYRGYSIFSTPPASSGGTHIIELLNILEQWNLQSLGQNSARSLHLWGEAMRLVYADPAPNTWADTAFVKVPIGGLTSKAYARELAAKIASDKPMAAPIGPGDPGNTNPATRPPSP